MLGLVIVTTVAAALVLVGAGGGRRPGVATGSGRRRRGSPASGLAVVTGLIYLNQVLFTVYVRREHGGDASFIARHVPDGWFTLADGAALESLARRFPAPELLAPSVLRVNAVLELPFVVLGYLTVCRWFSPATYERVAGLVWPMSLSYTATFCLIEWHLYNPYTVQDVVLRIAACIAVPWWVARLSPPSSRGRADNLAGLVVFLASAVGLGVLCLIVYDSALLYNLGHLDTQLPLAAVAVAVVAAARTIAPRVPDGPPGRGVDSIARSTGWLLVLAAVPALPIRYGLGFGAPYASIAGAGVLVATAAGLGARDAFARRPGRPVRWLVQLSGATVVGLCAATTALLVDAQHTETRLLVAGSAGLLAAISVCAALDRWAGVGHEPAPARAPASGPTSEGRR